MTSAQSDAPGLLAGTSARTGRRTWLLVAIAAAGVVADQWTKSWAQDSLAVWPHRRHVIGPVYLQLTYNRGAAFSFGAGAAPVIVAVAAVLAVTVIAVSGRLARGGGGRTMLVALGLVSGGALSNLADRFVRHHHGAVVDFVQLVSWWPVFNVADACITIGAVCAAVVLVFTVPAGARHDDGRRSL